MEIKLKSINEDFIISKLNTWEKLKTPLVIQYADFNVLNYFYECNLGNNELGEFFLYPDSTAVFFCLKYFLKKNLRKIISTDLQYDLLYKLNRNGARIYLFGDSDSILKKTIENIKAKHSRIRIIGSQNGYNFQTNEVISKINKNRIDILVVGLGAGQQEKWVLENYNKLNVKVILSVGGWFQYLAKNKKRAPKFLRRMNLEWLHKLVVEFPRVWKRYLIGIPKFYYRVITKKIVIHLDEK